MDLLRDRSFSLLACDTTGAGQPLLPCAGVHSLVGAAGLLRERRATTHSRVTGNPEAVRTGSFPRPGSLRMTIVHHRRGRDGPRSIWGLYICERIAGRDVREKIQIQMDYPVLSSIQRAGGRSGDPDDPPCASVQKGLDLIPGNRGDLKMRSPRQCRTRPAAGCHGVGCLARPMR